MLLADRTRSDGFVDLRLDGGHIEAGAALHRREVDQRLRRLPHDLLHEHETPELVGEPVVIGDRAIVLAVEHASAFVRIEAQIGQDRPVDLHRRAKPAAGLVGEAILVVVDAHRRQSGSR